MKVLKIDQNGDPVLVNGSYVFVEDLEAVQVTCEQVMRAQIGQYRYAQDVGNDYFDNLFTGNPNFQLFRVRAIEQLQMVQNVERVNSFTYNLVNGLYTYEAEIQTTFGAGTVNGSL